MTTVALRDGILASDSLANLNEAISPSPAQKLFHLHDGSIAAGTGDYIQVRKLLAAIERNDDSLPSIGDNSRLIRLFPDLSVRIYEFDYFFPYNASFGAWGSGSQFALAALLMGADARKAVEIACLLDPWSGGDIVEMKV